jgi:prepilin-type N-terminal cleavage/methylation domain-containing protein
VIRHAHSARSGLARTRVARRAFTLVELLTVTVLLAILAAVAIPQFGNITASARAAVAETNGTLEGRLALYKIEHGDQLPDLAAASAGGEHFKPLTQASTYGNPPVRRGPYLSAVPVNSATGGSLVMNAASFETDGRPSPVPGADFIYDFGGGGGSGKLWRTVDRATGAPAD